MRTAFILSLLLLFTPRVSEAQIVRLVTDAPAPRHVSQACPPQLARACDHIALMFDLAVMLTYEATPTTLAQAQETCEGLITEVATLRDAFEYQTVIVAPTAGALFTSRQAIMPPATLPISEMFCVDLVRLMRDRVTPVRRTGQDINGPLVDHAYGYELSAHVSSIRRMSGGVAMDRAVLVLQQRERPTRPPAPSAPAQPGTSPQPPRPAAAAALSPPR